MLVGAFITLLAGGLLAPVIAFPLSFGVAAVVGALPTFALMAGRLGPARAAALAALVATALAGASAVLALRRLRRHGLRRLIDR